MRPVTGLIMIVCFFASIHVFGQQINLSVKNASLEKVFAELEKQSRYVVFYKTELLRQLPALTVRIQNADITQALDQCLKNYPLTYTIMDSTVVITAKKNTSTSVGDNLSTLVEGRLADDNGNSLAGATVQLKGTAYGTLTDNDGEFALRLPAIEKGILQFSFVGYISQELLCQKPFTSLFIKLKENVGSLDQVQVIGYGQTSKRLNPGNVTTIKGEDIAKQPVNNVLAALQGRVPGMNIRQRTGMPGGSFLFNIRGANSIQNNNDPLFIIDGVPFPSGTLPLINTAEVGGSPLNYFDLSAIERVDILKDADATAIYGSRAANGVVLITTKKGKPGRTQIHANINTGIGRIASSPQFLNTQQYLAMRNEAKRNANQPVGPIDLDINGAWDTTRYTDWQNFLTGNHARSLNTQLNISGGAEGTQYFIGGGYRRQTSVQPGSGANRMGSLQFNISSKAFNKKLSLSLSANYSSDVSTILPYDFTSHLYFLPPNAPGPYNPDGTMSSEPGFPNPLLETMIRYKNNTVNLISNARISYSLSKNVDLLTTLGYNDMRSSEWKGTPRSYLNSANPSASPSSLFGSYKKNTWIIEPQLTYRGKMLKGSINALVGSTLQRNINENQQQTATGYSNDALLSNISAATDVATTAYNYTQYKYNALFGRIKYTLKQQYIINLNGRYDGSSRFGPHKQFHFFGSAGAAWIFRDEKRGHKNLSFISFGKLRLTYGSTGSDGINDYRYLDTYIANGSYAGFGTLYPSRLFNPDLAWELTRKAEVGLDLGFFHDRILINASYYRNRSSNQLVANALSAVTGFPYIYLNFPAIVQNKGIELELNTVNIRRSYFNWSTYFNITIPRNKLMAFPGLETSAYKSDLIVGQPLKIIKVFRYAGVNGQNGLYQFYDRNGNITQTPDPAFDKTAVIKVEPRFYGGLQNKFTYRNFYLDFLFAFVKQTGRNVFSWYHMSPPGLLPLAITPDVLTRWQKPGDITNVQRLSASFSIYPLQNITQNSTRAYGDASFIRLENLSFGYQCPGKWLKKVHLQELRLYVQAQNLLTITGYKTLDPENMSGTALPPLRVIAFGLMLTI